MNPAENRFTCCKPHPAASSRIAEALCWRWSAIAFLLCLGLSPAHAERYLTVSEARTISFPTADRFERKTVRFDAKQRQAIERQSGQKVRNKGNHVWIAFEGTNLLGVLVVDHVLGKHEIIDYAVAIAPEGSVRAVEILEYRESYGYEIRGERWRKQFKGKTSDSNLRLNDDIYNISGATISCRHVTQGIKRVLATYDLVLGPDLSDAHGLQNRSEASEK